MRPDCSWSATVSSSGPPSTRRRRSTLRPRGEPGDLGGVEVRPFREGPDRPRRRQPRLRQRPLQRPPPRPIVRRPDRQSPSGKGWKRDEDERAAAGRFAPGLPRIGDGRLLFLLHMLAHAKEPEEGGSCIAIIMNCAPPEVGEHDPKCTEAAVRRDSGTCRRGVRVMSSVTRDGRTRQVQRTQ